MFVCWSVKGGSGTTVVAAAMSMLLAARAPTMLVDLCGDVPSVLGAPEPAGPGVTDWLASTTAGAEALHRLTVEATEALDVLPRGTTASAPPSARWTALGGVLLHHHRHVVVDAGLGVPSSGLLPPGATSVLVVRPCYLALRRAVALGAAPDAVVLCAEPGRALGPSDVERSVRAPVVAVVPLDPAIARSVDAGLLAGRLPGSLAHALRGVA